MTFAVVTLLGRPGEWKRVRLMVLASGRLATQRWIHVVVADRGTSGLHGGVILPSKVEGQPGIVYVDEGATLAARYEAARRWLLDFSGVTHACFVDDDDIIAETHLREMELRAELCRWGSERVASGGSHVFLTDGAVGETIEIPAPLTAWTQTILSREALRAVAFEDCLAPDTRFMSQLIVATGPIGRGGGLTYACRIHKGNTRARFRDPKPLTVESMPEGLRSEWERIRAWGGAR